MAPLIEAAYWDTHQPMKENTDAQAEAWRNWQQGRCGAALWRLASGWSRAGLALGCRPCSMPADKGGEYQIDLAAAERWAAGAMASRSGALSLGRG